VRIVAVDAVKSNTCPSCIWQIYYELKHDNIEPQSDDSTDNGDILPADLPTNEEFFKKLFENITVGAIQFLGTKVLRKFFSTKWFYSHR
jgi:hypothetical protein